MKLVFTKSSSVLSRLIRWGLAEPVSHVAIIFDDKLIFQSNLLGVHLDGIYKFQKTNTIVYSLDIKLSKQAEELIYEKLLVQYDGVYYDFGALFYFFYQALLHKYFGTPWPDKNAWQKPENFLCDGLLTTLDRDMPPWFIEAISSLGDIEMKSPYAVYQCLIKKSPSN